MPFTIFFHKVKIFFLISYIYFFFKFQTSNGTYLPHGITGEYQAKHIEAGFGYQNTAFAHRFVYIQSAVLFTFISFFLLK